MLTLRSEHPYCDQNRGYSPKMEFLYWNIVFFLVLEILTFFRITAHTFLYYAN